MISCELLLCQGRTLNISVRLKGYLVILRCARRLSPPTKTKLVRVGGFRRENAKTLRGSLFGDVVGETVARHRFPQDVLEWLHVGAQISDHLIIKVRDPSVVTLWTKILSKFHV